MKVDDLNKMVNGWFIGDFSPSIYNTDSFEVAIKRYPAGAVEKLHYHKIATEFTCVVEGIVSFNDNVYKKNDIITIYPNEIVLFKSITDSITCVVKIPSVKDDKYLP
jgi:mannose-6-phosphate isomerase-like protein (cupin superfamily)